MRKILILCLLAVLGLSAVAMAEDNPIRPMLQEPSRAFVMPEARTGSCVLTTLDPLATVNSFGWADFDKYASYIDPTTDGDGGCTAPFYPFHITSVDVPLLFFFGPEGVGTTVNYRLSIHCPLDVTTGNVPQNCKGPGAEICGVDVSYTVTQEDFDAPATFVQNVLLDCCIEGPFYVVASFLSYDGTYGAAPTPGFDLTVGVPYSQRCDAWYYFNLGSGYCWLVGNLDFGCGSTCAPGDVALFVNGEAGVECTPIACDACPRNYPGDDASNPIVVDDPSWFRVIDLCDYCPDYDAIFDAPMGTFTGHGRDVVLTFTTAMDPSCFRIELRPASDCNEFFRIRSWLYDSVGPLSFGTPQFPGVGAWQTHNFSGDGAPDDFGCWFPDTYYLFLDSRQFCCCPVIVRFNGDNILGVELTSFDAIAGDGQVTLNWRTNAETDIERFEVSRNGEVVAEVAGLGNSATGHSYSFVDNNVVNGSAYSYRLTAYDINGTATVFGNVANATPTAGAGLVSEYALLQNYPNPFNPTTTIEYALRETGNVELKVFSVDGREVATLVEGVQDAGQHSVSFDATTLSSGMYMYKMTVNGFTASQKMVLMK